MNTNAKISLTNGRKSNPKRTLHIGDDIKVPLTIKIRIIFVDEIRNLACLENKVREASRLLLRSAEIKTKLRR